LKIFLNEDKLNDEYESLTFPQLLDTIKENLEDSILKQIYVNGIEVNEKYLQDSFLKKEDIKVVKFTTQTTKELITDTLKQIDNYLPKLKKGTLDTVNHFRNDEIEKGNNKYQYIIEGLEWYTGVISKIVSLLGNEDIYNKGQEMLNELNKTLTEIMVTHKKDDLVLLADILEYEIVDYIDDFIEFNNKIKNWVNK